MLNADVWTIAGFDPTGRAGVLVDKQIYALLGLQGHALITALTAQHDFSLTRVEPVDIHLFSEQLCLLKQLGWPKVIKIGLLPSKAFVHCLSQQLADFPGKIVYDPVMQASVGTRLMAKDVLDSLQAELLSRVHIITPNFHEASCLSGMPIHTTSQMQEAASALCDMGIKEVILKGGHGDGDFSQDLYCDANAQHWLTLPRLQALLHGSGCVFSAVLAGEMAKHDNTLDAFVMAKMLTYQALKKQHVPYWIKDDSEDFPWLTRTAQEGLHRLAFAPLAQPLGLYTIINEARWLLCLPQWGVHTLQWRDKESADQEKIKEAIKAVRKTKAQLFVNDDWQSAIQYQADGVHLGQEDLLTADLKAIQSAGLRLGVSTHSLTELATAKALAPSYIAFGPIYPTTTKRMIFAAQGLEKLARWRKWVKEPLVAIGGINMGNMESVLATKADSVAMVSAVTKAANPQLACQQLLSIFKENHALSTANSAPTSR